MEFPPPAVDSERKRQRRECGTEGMGIARSPRRTDYIKKTSFIASSWATAVCPVYRWEITRDSESGTTKLRLPGVTACPPGALPWLSSSGYRVTHDWWILSPTQKRLLWLPHHWRSVVQYRTWGGRFLGLFHSGLPEVVILEFLD